MLARIRVGDWRFIAAASGPPRDSQPCCACAPGVLRVLDLTAAYGCPSSSPINAIRAAARLSSRSASGPARARWASADHYDTNCAALVVRGCDHARHIGDVKSPVDRNSSSARTKK
jgi:hypothetical protein